MHPLQWPLLGMCALSQVALTAPGQVLFGAHKMVYGFCGCYYFRESFIVSQFLDCSDQRWFVCLLLLFYILAKSKVISGCVLTCDSAHFW